LKHPDFQYLQDLSLKEVAAYIRGQKRAKVAAALFDGRLISVCEQAILILDEPELQRQISPQTIRRAGRMTAGCPFVPDAHPARGRKKYPAGSTRT